MLANVVPVFFPGKLEAAKFVKEHYPEALTKLAQEPAQQWGSGVIASALGNNAGNLEVIEILLDAGEGIELSSKGHGKMGMLINFCDFARRFNFNKLQLSGMVMTFAYAARVPALSTAAFAGNLAALKLLLDRGADIHARGHNPRQLTALHFAAVRGHADVVAALLAAGARTDLKDKAGRTPADIAKQVGNHEIRQMLIGAVAEALAGSTVSRFGGARGKCGCSEGTQGLLGRRAHAHTHAYAANAETCERGMRCTIHRMMDRDRLDVPCWRPERSEGDSSAVARRPASGPSRTQIVIHDESDRTSTRVLKVIIIFLLYFLS